MFLELVGLMLEGSWRAYPHLKDFEIEGTVLEFEMVANANTFNVC